MTWQEYQEAVGRLYEQAEGVGTVRKNITIRDRVTGQPRQVDVWVEIHARGHVLGLLIDAKFRRVKVDVKDVEEVLALADAVGANKCVLVATNGWTEPAEKKARSRGMDLRLLDLDQALDLIVEDKWAVCEACNSDCVVLDSDGWIDVDGSFLWWFAGRCRECKAGFSWCQECGETLFLRLEAEATCNCGYTWRNGPDGFSLRFPWEEAWIPLRGEKAPWLADFGP